MWKRAFKDTLPELGNSWGKRIRNFFFLVIALLIVRWLGGWEQMSEEMRWLISSGIALLVVLLGLFLFNLIRAPVYIKFEEKTKPCLEIECVTEQLYGGLGSVRGLIIHNQGTDRADDCQGRLVEMEFAIPRKGQSLFRFPTNQPLKWGEEPEGISSGNIFIPGLSKATLMIVRWASIRVNPRLAYACIDDPHRDTLLTGYEILLVISIMSQNSAPIYAICLLDLGRKPEGWDLKLLDKRPQQPTIDDCRQLIPLTEENGSE